MSDEESPAASDSEAGSDTEEKPEEVEAPKKVVAARPPPTSSDVAGLEDADKELLSNNKEERSRMEDEIRELRDRNEKRKKEREIEEKRLTAERAAEDQRRKADEEDRKRKKEEDELRKKGERAQKMAEFEKWKTPQKANFVISKKLSAAEGEEGEDQGEESEVKARKSKEQLEAEKRAILKQRLKPLEISGADNAKLTEKAKELHQLLARLEGERYDLEKRFKTMQTEMMSLAERARQANKVGKEGTVKRVDDYSSSDKVMEKYAGAPSKVEMFSKYERQKDKRTYDDRKVLYTGPMYGSPADRIKPNKVVRWTEEGLPIYEGGSEPAAA